jgi:protein-disulfide isomerase
MSHLLRQIPRLFAAGLLLAGAVCGEQKPKAEKPPRELSKSEKEQFEALIKDYLLRNPSVIRDAIIVLQNQERAAAAERAARAAKDSQTELFDDPGAQYMGSASPDVSLALFFDYRCGYCKQMMPTLQKLVENDPKLRIVLLELPILGPESLFAAKAALASRSQGKYLAFHKALMASRDLKEENVRKLARELGLGEDLFSRLESKEIADTLRKTAELAGRLEIQGTPGFVLGEKVLPGAVSYEGLTQLIREQREKNKVN